MIDQYIFSGSLPENASTYVKRKADSDLYEGLKAGKFCYVLNSRQSGKSSLRVQTMRRLRDDGVECAAIDLSAGGIQNVPPEQWYADLIDTLIESFGLDLDFADWWEAYQLNSLVTRFRKFLEEILLAKVKENIVIFIDEIDSVLSLKFPTDDFFALIRACYNKRVDNPEYNRLTFCLLGVASPSNLIEDKQRTPFNIGKAISLTGFQLHEVEPLEKGLHGRFTDSQAVMKEILYWTGGQPFLTQKLCQFMVEESLQDNPRSVEQVVRSRIIDNWESQDEPEHLRTIRARILRNEQRAGYLLELYQQIRRAEAQAEITADDTLEQNELQLSGLVVRQQNKLKVYNPIYRDIFDSYWIETQLRNLRPYSENFKFWVDSGSTDESRLLRGKALQEAEEWASDKSLSYQDKQYLAASKEKEIKEKIAAEEREAALERARKDRAATEKRNQVLSEANKKAQRRISIGVIVLVVAVLGAGTVGIFSNRQIKAANKKLNNANIELQQANEKTKDANKKEQDAKKSEQDAKKSAFSAQQQAKASKIKNDETKAEVKAVQELNKLAGLLQKKRNSDSEEVTFDSNEALRLSALSFDIDNHQLKQALVFAATAQAYQQLKKLKEAEKQRIKSQEFLSKADKKALYSNQGLQIQILFHKSKGSLLAQKKETQKAIESYTTAFNLLKSHSNETDFTKLNQLITAENIDYVHQGLIALLSKNNTKSKLRKQVEESLTQHLYAQVKYYLNAKKWQEADYQTYRLMLNIAKREKELYLDYDNINSFSCPDLRKIDKLWVDNSNNRFGFSVQKEIWIETGNRLGIKPEDWNSKDEENYLRFAQKVGWYNDKDRNSRGGAWVDYNEYMSRIKNNPSYGRGGVPLSHQLFNQASNILFSRCDL